LSCGHFNGFAGVVPEQEEQRAAAETADVHGPGPVLRGRAEDARVPVEHEPGVVGRPAARVPVLRRFGRGQVRVRLRARIVSPGLLRPPRRPAPRRRTRRTVRTPR